MKEELQSKLVEILTSIQTAAGKASDFAMDQLPDIAQSYVVYGRAYTALMEALFVAVFVVGLFCATKFGFRSSAKTSYGGWTDGRFFACMGGLMLAGVGAVGAAAHLSGMLLVWFAPKVWLLKEIATLLK